MNTEEWNEINALSARVRALELARMNEAAPATAWQMYMGQRTPLEVGESVSAGSTTEAKPVGDGAQCTTTEPVAPDGAVLEPAGGLGNAQPASLTRDGVARALRVAWESRDDGDGWLIEADTVLALIAQQVQGWKAAAEVTTRSLTASTARNVNLRKEVRATLAQRDAAETELHSVREAWQLALERERIADRRVVDANAAYWRLHAQMKTKVQGLMEELR